MNAGRKMTQETIAREEHTTGDRSEGSPGGPFPTEENHWNYIHDKRVRNDHFPGPLKATANPRRLTGKKKRKDMANPTLTLSRSSNARGWANASYSHWYRREI